MAEPEFFPRGGGADFDDMEGKNIFPKGGRILPSLDTKYRMGCR